MKAQWAILFPAKTKWIFFPMYNIKDQACIRNTGLTFLFCTLECGTDHSNFRFPSSWPAIKYLRLLRISSSTNFPRYDPLIIENDTVQRRIIQLRILKFQILKVKKKIWVTSRKKVKYYLAHLFEQPIRIPKMFWSHFFSFQLLHNLILIFSNCSRWSKWLKFGNLNFHLLVYLLL